MKKPQKFIVLLWVLASLACNLRAALVGTQIPQVVTRDGPVLKNVVIITVSPSGVMAKWDGGRGSIRADDLPEDIRSQLPPPTVAPVAAAPLIQPRLTPETGPVQTISGQAFITMRSGGSVKLSSVQVWVYSEQDYKDQMGWLKKGPLAQYDSLISKSKIYRRNGDYTLALSALVQAQGLAHRAYASMPKPESAATTDADGRFIINHRVEAPYFVVCAAKRLTGGDTEYYHWAVGSEEIKDPANLLLHNANLLNR